MEKSPASPPVIVVNAQAGASSTSSVALTETATGTMARFGGVTDDGVAVIGAITGAVTSGVNNYLEAYTSWGYAQQAFDRWSQQLRRRLDQINGRAAG